MYSAAIRVNRYPRFAGSLAKGLMPTLHFLLVPDKSFARRVRRMAAENQPRLGVLVGTWPELLSQAREAYLLPEPENWTEALKAAAESMKGAFWSRSITVAPDETISEIGKALAVLIEGVGPGKKVALDTKNVLTGRARNHLADLASLHEKLKFLLPTHLATIDEVLRADAKTSIRKIAVYHVPGFPDLFPWQKALVEKLAKDNDGPRDKELEDILKQSLQWQGAKRGTALAVIQQNLFDPKTKPVKLDETVQWLAVRDYLEEAEVAAGMAQKIMRDEKAKASEIGLLVPAQRAYYDAIRDAFSFAGIPVAGLEAERSARDLGREAVLNFLTSRRWPAPVMALAALYSNPLMPWPAGTGCELAQNVIGGNFEPWLPKDASEQDRSMAGLISKKDLRNSLELAGALHQFGSLMSKSNALWEHRKRALDLLDELVGLLPEKGEIPWQTLLARSAPSSFTVKSDGISAREGVAVFAEGEEPWRQVRFLIVLGFSSGRYPAEQSSSPVFLESDITRLKEKLAYAIVSGSDEVVLGRMLFKRQLTAATDAAVFLIPRRDSAGDELHPSDTLAFMARVFIASGGKDTPEAESLIRELDTEEGRAAARWLALARPTKAGPAWSPKVRDLDLKRDILATIRVDRKDGKPKPESPTSLEKMLVSPFGWILGRAGLEDRNWEPEDLDVALKGSIAHNVLELFFNHQQAIPTAAAIKKDLPANYGRVVRETAPFLLAPEWSIETRHLEQEILEAALWWRERLVQMQAKIVGAEATLNGAFERHPLTGKTDLLLEMAGGQLFVVDYKKSLSEKFRTMMNAGYAVQVALYRIMLETGTYTPEQHEKLGEVLMQKREIGVLYALLNDRKILTDSSGWLGTGQQDVTEMGQHIADDGLALLKQRFSELRKGIVRLNTEADEKWHDDNSGITAKYALDASPLVRLFMHPVETEEETAE